MNLVRRFYVDDRNFCEIVVVFADGDKRQLSYENEQEMMEAWEILQEIILVGGGNGNF
jgi:hypothetical protein